MKRKTLYVIAAAVAAVVLLTVCLVLSKGDQNTEDIVGTWMIYEGGYVAPEVLTFNRDGTGMAYALSDADRNNSMTDVQIPRSRLEHAEDFRWSIKDGMLTFIYDSGKQESLEIAFDTTAAVRILSLRKSGGSGGWVPAEIID